MQDARIGKAPMLYCHHDSPIGPLTFHGIGDRLHGLHFAKQGQPIKPDPDWVQEDRAFGEARRQVDAYFAGDLTHFSLDYHLDGSPFQLEVWHALEAIPFGELRSYGDIARAVGQPGGAQAVGMANNANPIPIIVPCHRVIGVDGALVGFGGGLQTKIWLLEHEKINPSQVHSPNQMGFDF